MTPEVTVLTLAALLAMGQFIAFSIAANRDLGPGYTMSARDRAPSREMSLKTGRLSRAYENHMEWLMLFGLAVVVVQLSGQNSALTAGCAWCYLIARIAYIPAYVLGLRPWRSVIWAVGFFATTIMFLAALIPVAP